MKNNILTGIVIGAIAVLLVFVIARMTYDSGKAAGRADTIEKMNQCIIRCDTNKSSQQVEYRESCFAVCMAEGSSYDDYYPGPFPFG